MDARARVLRRGDNVKIHSTCNEIESGHSVLLFLTQLSDKNDYGEILFFQDVSVDFLLINILNYTVKILLNG